MSIARVTNVITKTTMAIDFPELNFANRKSNAVANIVGRLRARSRTPVHHNSYESDPTWALGESNQFIATMCIIDSSVRERLPVVIIIGVQVHRIVTGPVFHSTMLCVRRAPMNTNGVNWLRRAKIDHDPLRMRIFGLPGEMRIEIRITFPE